MPINSQDIYKTDAHFDVICKRCGKKFTVIRNWGGGLRREQCNNKDHYNPAKCDCGSQSMEIF